jgi:hypothetical protein
MMDSKRVVHVSLAEALSKGPPPPGNLAVPIFSHGSVVVELYAPVGHDPQQPHSRDEVYFVTRGKGLFLMGSTDTQLKRVRSSLLRPARFTVSRISLLTSPSGSLFMDWKEEKVIPN